MLNQTKCSLETFSNTVSHAAQSTNPGITMGFATNQIRTDKIQLIFLSTSVNSGQPSDDNSSGIPYVTKILHRLSIRPLAPSIDLSTTGQLE